MRSNPGEISNALKLFSDSKISPSEKGGAEPLSVIFLGENSILCLLAFIKVRLLYQNLYGLLAVFHNSSNLGSD